MFRALIFAPLLFLLVLFALSNPQTVTLGMWPSDVNVELPLSIALLLASAVSFLLGALLIWFSLIGARLRARRAEQAARLLEAQIATLQARPAEAPAAAPTITGTALTTQS